MEESGVACPHAEGARGVGVNEWLCWQDVKEAIHARADVSWTDCSDMVFNGYSYTDRDSYMEPIYTKLVYVCSPASCCTLFRMGPSCGTEDLLS